jgi:hypothetical protein
MYVCMHLFSDIDDMESLADFGVLFLLFEQGVYVYVYRERDIYMYILMSTTVFS